MSTKLLEDKKVSLRLNKKYNVIIHNDEVTTFDCVILVLQAVFGYSEDQAVQTAMLVHIAGSAVVGKYPKDIAETKRFEAMDIAKGEGFPLTLTVEKAL